MSLKEKLRQRVLSASVTKDAAVITDSKIFGKKEAVQTQVPMVNVALGGEIDGGLTPGLTVLAGPSKHFKTGFSLLMMKAFQEKYGDDGVIIFYDVEFGTPLSYFETFDIDLSGVVHIPIMNIEELKFDVVQQLEELTRKDNVMIVVDSIGNIASKKEIEDAKDGKSVADMTRAKQLKSLFRMVTPYLTMKAIPMVCINHTYQTQEMFSKAVVSGGTGVMYSADNVWIIGRQQDKVGKDIEGYHFIINVEKSRYVKEKSKIPISISWETGINRWSGLLEQAMEYGCVTKTKPGWYAIVDMETGEVGEKSLREKQIVNNSAFWTERFENTDLAQFISDKYSVDGAGLILDDGEEEDVKELVDEDV